MKGFTMKKLLTIFAAASAVFAANAETFNLEPPMPTLTEEWRNGSMTGKNSCSGKINGKLYKDVYHFWYLKKGVTPDTAELAPLNAISPDSKGAKLWEKHTPILAAGVKENGVFTFPALQKNSMVTINTKFTFGMAYGVMKKQKSMSANAIPKANLPYWSKTTIPMPWKTSCKNIKTAENPTAII